MIAGPDAYLCSDCIREAAQQLAPRPLEAVYCQFCRKSRQRSDTARVGSVVVCAECQGLIEEILAENAGATRLDR
jgi:hypothetical protein